MDSVDRLVALQHRIHSCESDHGTALQITERFGNVQTVSEYTSKYQRAVIELLISYPVDLGVSRYVNKIFAVYKMFAAIDIP